LLGARSPSGKAKVCKTFIGGSIPPRASKIFAGRGLKNSSAFLRDALQFNSEVNNYKSSWRKVRVACLICFAIAMLAAPRFASAQAKIDGLWDATVTVGEAEIPFRFEIATSNGQTQGFFFEGEKKIGSSSGRFSGDALNLQYDQLFSELTATVQDDELRGSYRYKRKKGKTYEFHARRFQTLSANDAQPPQVAGNWEMKLVGEDKSPTKDARAVLSWKLFLRQSGAEVTGSILRVDGDTGTLTGRWQDKKLVLSHFAGERPVLFEADLLPDGTFDVTYNRLNKYLAARTGEARAKGIPEPPDPSRYTSVNDPTQAFHFQFPGVDGAPVSDKDARFQGKVLLLTIGGTWCPNCRDEAPFLVALYKDYHARGLEIVGLNFEAAGDATEDNPRIAEFIREFGVPYPVLLAGAIGDVKDKLPQIVNFGAYPTTIFLGRDGRVRSVHAGFASSATGEASAELAQETRKTVNQLLAEVAPPSTAASNSKVQ
jgi:thiol-disulfide isomerase/thioredoxin